MDITYTIIIPHKDIPDLLQRCLATIPQRADVQVIVVDDNSNPDKVDFSQFPGLGRTNIECYFTKEGKGAGYARNVGLQHARGKWLLFADADDFFHEGMLEILDKWKDSNRDMIYFNCDTVDSDTLEPAEPRLWIRLSQTSREYWENSCEWHVPWGKMIRADMVQSHNIIFDEVRVSNDVMFSAYCGYYAKDNIDISLETLYCATERKNSLTTEKWNEERVMCRLGVTLRYARFTYKHHLKGAKPSNGCSWAFHALGRMKENGTKAYRKAIIYYLRHACFRVLVRDFIGYVKFRM